MVVLVLGYTLDGISLNFELWFKIINKNDIIGNFCTTYFEQWQVLTYAEEVG